MPAPILVQAGEPRALTPQQVADLLACSLDHTYRLIEERRLAAVNLALARQTRKLYRIPLAAVQRFLQDATVS